MNKNEHFKELKKGHQIFDDKLWFKVDKLLAKNVSINAAIFFGYLYDTESYALNQRLEWFSKNNFWFYSKKKRVEQELNLNFNMQIRAIKELEDIGFIETKLGQGKIKYFRIKWKVYTEQRDKWYSDQIENRKNEFIKNTEFKEYNLPEGY